jgi:hypothetical protein
LGDILNSITFGYWKKFWECVDEKVMRERSYVKRIFFKSYFLMFLAGLFISVLSAILDGFHIGLFLFYPGIMVVFAGNLIAGAVLLFAKLSFKNVQDTAKELGIELEKFSDYDPVRQFEFSSSVAKEKLFSIGLKLADIFEEGAEVHSQDLEKGEIVIIVMGTWKSLGENLVLHFKELDSDQTLVSITSSSVTQAEVDNGKNLENVVKTTQFFQKQ